MNIAPPPPRTAGSPKPPRTLVTIVGAAVAIALGVSIPADESGRTVEASLNQSTGALQVQHVRGRQYLRAYLDIVGVATACDGLTRNADGSRIHTGQTFTETQCSEMLERALVEHASGVMACSPGLALSNDPATERRRQGPRFAAVSLAYNVGVANYCRSTVRARFNAGAYSAGCDALRAWNKAGGRVVRGLTDRRERERRVCLQGLAA